MAKKRCDFCGKEYDSNDKKNILFRSASGERIRICSECVLKCNELYKNKMAQEKLTQIKKQEVEDQRKITEHKRALADMEYRKTMAMTASEFIQLRTLEIIQEKPNANIDVLFGNAGTSMWDVKKK